tara:strand:+ start:398 stop:556 length:159 start_codon:yes stop_codon:yes gene_type:complete
MFRIEIKNIRGASLYTIIETFNKPNKYGDTEKIYASFRDYDKAINYLNNLKK